MTFLFWQSELSCASRRSRGFFGLAEEANLIFQGFESVVNGEWKPSHRLFTSLGARRKKQCRSIDVGKMVRKRGKTLQWMDGRPLRPPNSFGAVADGIVDGCMSGPLLEVKFIALSLYTLLYTHS
jgi:hypothetical protein